MGQLTIDYTRGRWVGGATLLPVVTANVVGEWVDLQGFRPIIVAVEASSDFVGTVQLFTSNAPTPPVAPGGTTVFPQIGNDVTGPKLVVLDYPGRWICAVLSGRSAGSVAAYLFGGGGLGI